MESARLMGLSLGSGFRPNPEIISLVQTARPSAVLRPKAYPVSITLGFRLARQGLDSSNFASFLKWVFSKRSLGMRFLKYPLAR
jgi:hypothetical protein